MAECIDCHRRLGRTEEAFSLCTPDGFGCICVGCGKQYVSEEAVFARLRTFVATGPAARKSEEEARIRAAS